MDLRRGAPIYNNKRVFGQDITNIERRGKNFSISQKPSQLSAVEQRLKSKSVSFKPVSEGKDPIQEYEKQIVDHMLSIAKQEKTEMYKYIHEDMRYVLLDWMIEVHESFELKEQTLHLALTYLNQFTSKAQVTKHEYQLVGITCLWIASKYEEIYPPKMRNYVDVTDNSYTVQELKDMEGRIIQTLGFNLTYTTTLNLLEAMSDKWEKERNIKKELVLTRDALKNLHMCKFLLELASIGNLYKTYNTQTLVLGAITLTDSIFKGKSEIKLLDEEQKPERQTLLKCFREMCALLQDCQNHKRFNAVVKKYQREKYSKVARIKIAQK